MVSTNVAETSITIQGIVYVIDSGFTELKAYHADTGFERIITYPTSQSSAIQRAGRAGRTRPGKVYRLYTEEFFSKLPEMTVPEMQRLNVGSCILQLKAIGIENILQFDFLSPPSSGQLTRALEMLYSLNALDDKCTLTKPFGAALAIFPLDPMLAAILLNSPRYKCTEEALTIVAMLSVERVFMIPRGQQHEAEDSRRRNFAVQEGDHITYINGCYINLVYQAFIKSQKNRRFCSMHYLDYKALCRVSVIRNYLVQYLRRAGISKFESCRNNVDDLGKCLVSGYFSQAARIQHDGSYATIRDHQILHIHPKSVLAQRSPQWVIYHQVYEGAKAYMRDVTVIEPEWLTEIAPHYYVLQ